jgi:hypothetical protein
MLNKPKKEIIRTWIAGLDKPSHVVVEGRPEGILIKKLEI